MPLNFGLEIWESLALMLLSLRNFWLTERIMEYKVLLCKSGIKIWKLCLDFKLEILALR